MMASTGTFSSPPFMTFLYVKLFISLNLEKGWSSSDSSGHSRERIVSYLSLI